MISSHDGDNDDDPDDETDDDNDDVTQPSVHHHRDIFSCVSLHDFLTSSYFFFTPQLMVHRVKNDAIVDEVASLFHELHPHGN